MEVLGPGNTESGLGLAINLHFLGLTTQTMMARLLLCVVTGMMIMQMFLLRMMLSAALARLWGCNTSVGLSLKAERLGDVTVVFLLKF